MTRGRIDHAGSQDSTQALTVAGCLRRLLAGAALALALVAPAAAQQAAMLFPDSINDQSWNTAGYNGLKQMEAMGYKIAYTEYVQSADHVAAMRGYAKGGYNLVFGHSGRFLSAAERVAAEFPTVQFVVGAGAKGLPPNVRSIDINRAQFAYAAGVLAAEMSKTGRVAVVAGLEGLPTMVAFVGGFRLGAMAAKPDIKVEAIYLSNMEDTAAAKEAAFSTFANGADVITGVLAAGQAQLIQVAQERGGFAFGRSLAHTAIAPGTVLANTVEDWPAIYKAAAAEMKDGQLRGDYRLYGYDTAPSTGASLRYDATSPFNPKVTPEALKKVEAAMAGMQSKAIVVAPTRQDARPGL